MNTSDARRPIGTRLGAAVAVALTAGALAAGCGSSKSSQKPSAASGPTTPSTAASTIATRSAGTASSASPGSVDGGASPSVAASSSLPAKPTDVGPGGPRDCSTDMLKLTIDPLREPINHVVISATNISQLPCHLNKYPLLRTFSAQQTPMKVADATKPAAVILLAPGATAYAGVTTSAGDGSGTNGRNVTTLQLQLQPSGGGGGVGRPASVAMPPGAQYVDGSAVVTYWESDMQSAIY